MYFDNCKTEEETKKAFKHLCFILHPDLAGSHADFIAMHDEYQRKLQSLHGTYNNAQDAKEGKRKYQYDATVERDLVNMIRALQGLHLPDTIEIHLQGTWIWVKGHLKNAYGHYPVNPQYGARLEAIGLKLHTMKGEYYYRDPKRACHNKGKVMRFDRIAARYNGARFDNSGDAQVN